MQKMQVQQTILATLRSDLPTLSELVTSNQDKSRQALGKLICSKFKLLNTKGRPRISGCMKALYVLEEEGHVSLPKPQTASFVRGPRLLEESVPAPVDVPADVRQIQDLEILLVTGSQARAIWNTLLAREHPKGTTTFAGAQVRYLIRSTSGYLSAVGFSAAALHLGARDAWMAWDLSTRMQNLYRVANLSRFLIRPEIRCKNLASSILARVLHRLPSDFMARYDYAPYVVETFVGPDYDGTCFRAAGFHYLGRTKGQGRHASATDAPKSKKKIFAYELDPNWRTHLGVPFVDLYPRLEPGTGLDADHWANQEFGRAELGDRRRTARLVKSVRLMANTVGTPSTASPKRDSAALQGYYRFFAKADELGISNEDIHAPHLQRTIERMRTQETVLFIQDGTKLSFTTRTNTEGFDVIGENQTSAKAYGIHLHATIAVSAEEGLPLGIVNCSYGKQTPKTQTWLDGLRAVEKASETLPRKTRAICVMDREADAFEILSEQRALQRTEILVRAKHDRVLDKSKNTRLFRTMRKGSPAGLVELKVEDLSRRMKSGRVTSEGRPGRNARMEIRFRKVMLPPTKDPAQAPMPVWGVHLRELNPPEDAKPIEWYLVTTQEVTSLKEAQQMINYYKLRWRVEDTFRVLKSGCKVEKLRFQKPKVLHRVLTVYMIITWRIMLMTLMGRVAGDLEMEVFFRGSEAKMLQVYAENYRLPVPTNVSSAILTVAMMGGYMNRKHDPPPGHEIMWRGYSSLQIRAVAYEELEAIGKVNW